MTGAEALQKIIDSMDALTTTVNELKHSVQLIEANIKTLNNRAAGLIRNQGQTENTVSVAQSTYISSGQASDGGKQYSVSSNVLSAGVPNQKAQPVVQATPTRGRQLTEYSEELREEAKNPTREAKSDGPNVLTYKKTFGRLLNSTNEPVENILIKIYDKNNEVCATTETDPIGYWETMLKPGRYVAECVKSGFKTSNKSFEVGKNVKEVEVK